MTAISAAPFLFLASFSVGTDEYSAHLSQAEFKPTQPTSSFVDIAGTTSNFGGKSSWTLELGGAQDWATVNSLSSFLTTHDGDEATVSLKLPGGTWAATVICAATTIGGTALQAAVFQVTLQVKGKPEFTAGV